MKRCATHRLRHILGGSFQSLTLLHPAHFHGPARVRCATGMCSTPDPAAYIAGTLYLCRQWPLGLAGRLDRLPPHARPSARDFDPRRGSRSPRRARKAARDGSPDCRVFGEDVPAKSIGTWSQALKLLECDSFDVQCESPCPLECPRFSLTRSLCFHCVVRQEARDSGCERVGVASSLSPSDAVEADVRFQAKSVVYTSPFLPVYTHHALAEMRGQQARLPRQDSIWKSGKRRREGHLTTS